MRKKEVFLLGGRSEENEQRRSEKQTVQAGCEWKANEEFLL